MTMKNLVLSTTIALVLSSFSIYGQSKITIDATKFNYPLIGRWILEYNKENPQVEIKLAAKSSESNTANIQIITRRVEKEEIKDNQEVVYVCEYALLPVTSKSNSFLKSIRKDGLTKKEIKELFFNEESFDDNTEKPIFPVTIYARESQSSSAQIFANYFGYKPNQILGKKIAGDDVYLISAIKKDTSGITFNTLGNIYDSKTRKIKEGLTLLPIDIGRKAYTGLTTTLDEALTLLENNRFETIPVDKVGFVYLSKGDKSEIVKFISWVLSKGQDFNHEYGFQNLNKDILLKQQDTLAELFFSAK
jgi:phosphate transport system substrate-binding protein